jgi:hypothetical protein
MFVLGGCYALGEKNRKAQVSQRTSVRIRGEARFPLPTSVLKFPLHMGIAIGVPKSAVPDFLLSVIFILDGFKLKADTRLPGGKFP